jgi:hypothetical protein
MLGKRQFSLGYLFLEVSLFAIAFGLNTVRVGPSQTGAVIAALLCYPIVICLCAAILGLFNHMKRGVVVGLVLGTIAFVPSLIFALTGGV